MWAVEWIATTDRTITVFMLLYFLGQMKSEMCVFVCVCAQCIRHSACRLPGDMNSTFQ